MVKKTTVKKPEPCSKCGATFGKANEIFGVSDERYMEIIKAFQHEMIDTEKVSESFKNVIAKLNVTTIPEAEATAYIFSKITTRNDQEHDMSHLLDNLLGGFSSSN